MLFVDIIQQLTAPSCKVFSSVFYNGHKQYICTRRHTSLAKSVHPLQSWVWHFVIQRCLQYISSVVCYISHSGDGCGVLTQWVCGSQHSVCGVQTNPRDETFAAKMETRMHFKRYGNYPEAKSLCCVSKVHWGRKHQIISPFSQTKWGFFHVKNIWMKTHTVLSYVLHVRPSSY